MPLEKAGASYCCIYAFNVLCITCMIELSHKQLALSGGFTEGALRLATLTYRFPAKGENSIHSLKAIIIDTPWKRGVLIIMA